MKIQIEATENIVNIAGIECRLWKGTTENGTPCKVFVHRVAVHNDDDSIEFENELIEKMPPAAPTKFDLRHVL